MKNNDLENHVARFINNQLPKGSSFLVGFSGGVDSTALLHLLHRSSVCATHRCHVLHVDHGWREESAHEATVLERRVSSLGIPFSCIRLPKCPSGENIEDWSRRQRLKWFSDTASSLGCRAVLLAHQADDQVEVVLKRFLEGSSVTKFRGMRSVENRNSLTIMRPLLSIRRSLLLDYLHDHSIPYLIDPTNKDTSFLRARMREVVFPFLRESFGKEFDATLLRIANESADLERFVHEECSKQFIIHKFRTDQTCDVAFASVRDGSSPSPFLVRCLVDQLKESVGLSCLSRFQVERAVEIFCGRPAGAKHFYSGKGGVIAESGFFAAFAQMPQPIETIDVQGTEGCKTIGPWEISWKPSLAPSENSISWHALFSENSITWYVPQQPFSICRVNDQIVRTLPRQQVLSPSFVSLRPFVPALSQAFRLVVEPLSGYTIPLSPGSACFAVTIQRVKEPLQE